MNIPINYKSATLAACALGINILLTLGVSIVDFEIQYSLLFSIETLSRFLKGFVLFYLIMFLNQVSGTRALNIPLFCWLILLSVMIVFYAADYFSFIEYDKTDSYFLVTVAGFFILTEIFLIVRIFMVGSVPYKSYFNWFAALIMVQLVGSIARPFITVYLVQQGMEHFQKNNGTVDLIHTILHQLPFIVLLILFMDFVQKNRIAERLIVEK